MGVECAVYQRGAGMLCLVPCSVPAGKCSGVGHAQITGSEKSAIKAKRNICKTGDAAVMDGGNES